MFVAGMTISHEAIVQFLEVLEHLLGPGYLFVLLLLVARRDLLFELLEEAFSRVVRLLNLGDSLLNRPQEIHRLVLRHCIGWLPGLGGHEMRVAQLELLVLEVNLLELVIALEQLQIALRELLSEGVVLFFEVLTLED